MELQLVSMHGERDLPFPLFIVRLSYLVHAHGEKREQRNEWITVVFMTGWEWRGVVCMRMTTMGGLRILKLAAKSALLGLARMTTS